MHHPLLTVVAAMALLAPLSWQTPPASAATAPTTPAGTPQARVIVKFKADSPLLRKQVQSASDQHTSQAQTLGQRTGLALRSGAGVADRTQVMFASGMTSSQLAARLAQEGDIEYAVVDQRRHRFAAPNDPLYAAGLGGNGPAVGQWYLRAPLGEVKSSLDMETAWAITTGSSAIVVAVLDTGVRFDDVDLQRVGAGGNLLPGYDMIHDVPVGNDGDGRDADPSDPGDWVTQAEIDLVGGPFSGCTSGPEDSSWHGTQVSGLIGALTDNGIGMASVGRNVRVLPVRVLGKCGGFDSDIIAGMRWAAGLNVPGVSELHPNLTRARVLNMSLGGDGPCTAVYQQAVAEINATGAVVVASAGNSAGHSVSSPANCPGVIGVAGLRHVGSKVGFSDLGPEISLSAPAGDCVNIGVGQPCLYPILTTSNGGTTVPLAGSSVYTDSFNTSLGTSFSAPLVAGTVGLMLSAQPALTAAEVLAVLKASARSFPTTGGSNDDNTPVRQCTAPQFDASNKPVDQLQCYCTTTTCGAGMLNAGAAVSASFAGLQASIVGSANATALQTVTLSAAQSFVITGGSIRSYAWTLVDRGGIVTDFNTATGAVVTLTPNAAGRFTVSLTITDDLGTTSTSSLSVDVAAAAPIPIDPPPSGGGGGAVGAWWLLLLGLAVMLVRRGRTGASAR